MHTHFWREIAIIHSYFNGFLSQRLFLLCPFTCRGQYLTGISKKGFFLVAIATAAVSCHYFKHMVVTKWQSIIPLYKNPLWMCWTCDCFLFISIFFLFGNSNRNRVKCTHYTIHIPSKTAKLIVRHKKRTKAPQQKSQVPLNLFSVELMWSSSEQQQIASASKLKE